MSAGPGLGSLNKNGPQNSAFQRIRGESKVGAEGGATQEMFWSQKVR